MTDLVNIYIGRQPIFDKSMRVYGYELLFRSGHEKNHANVMGGDNATAQVMMNLFGDLGLSDVVGDKKAFINFTEGLLLRENRPFFMKKQLVIEVLEDVKVSKELVSALQKLKDAGYTIALDDYVFNPELHVLEQYADVIKVDILEVGPKKLLDHVNSIKNKGILLLAEKVETKEQYDFCVRIGFDLFQGYFFSKPTIIKGQSLPNNKLTMMELLANVYDPQIDMAALSKIISRDVSLSQKLLKFAATVGGKHSISSIHDAVLRFGLMRLQSWVSMLVLTTVSDKPSELFVTSLVRARFCELVGERVGDFSKETYFTVGLFSSLDAIMDAPLEDLLADLSFDNKIKQAINNYEGSLGVALAAVKSLEKGKVEFDLPKGLTPTELSKYYLEAMHFASSVHFH